MSVPEKVFGVAIYAYLTMKICAGSHHVNLAGGMIDELLYEVGGTQVMRLALLIALVFATASGCVSTHMKQFIGKDARYIAVKDGMPINVFDLPDGQRAFQYRVGGGSVTAPTTTTTTGQLQMAGSGAYYAEQKIESGGFTVNVPGCLITYLARWSPERQGWIVTDISYPKQLVC